MSTIEKKVNKKRIRKKPLKKKISPTHKVLDENMTEAAKRLAHHTKVLNDARIKNRGFDIKVAARKAKEECQKAGGGMRSWMYSKHQTPKNNISWMEYTKDKKKVVPKLKDNKMAEDVLNAPQTEVLPVTVNYNLNIFAQICAAYPSFAIARGIVSPEFVTIGGNTVDTLYLAYVTVCYDYWLAMHGQFTVLEAAPWPYWEMRDLLSPVLKASRDYSYSVPETFIAAVGGMFPASGIPFQVGGPTTFAWPTDLSLPLSPLANVVPVLTNEQIESSGVEALANLFNKLAEAGSTTLHSYLETGMHGSAALYSWVSGLQGKSFNFAADTRTEGFYGISSLESDLQPFEQWAGKIGLVKIDGVEGAGRLSSYSKTGFIGVINYYDRVANEIYVGRKSDMIPVRSPVPNPIYIETIIQSLMVQLAKAQMYKHSVSVRLGVLVNDGAGNAIVGTTFMTDFSNVSVNQLVFGVTQHICRLYAGTSWISAFSMPDEFTLPLSGRKFACDISVGGFPIMSNIAEFKGDTSPFPKPKSDVIMYPVLVSRGMYRIIHQMNSTGAVLTNLGPLFSDFIVGYDPSITVPLAADISGLPNFVDPLGTSSQMQGSGFITANLGWSSLVSGCVGNLVLSSGQVYHPKRTRLYFKYMVTNLGVLPVDNDGFSDFGSLVLHNVSHIRPFPTNYIGELLSNPLPMCFYLTEVQRRGFLNMYSTTSSMKYEEPEDLYTILTEGALNYVRDQRSEVTGAWALSDIQLMCNMSGDFSFIKNLLKRGVGMAKNIMDSGVPQKLLNQLNKTLNGTGSDEALEKHAGAGGVVMPPKLGRVTLSSQFRVHKLRKIRMIKEDEDPIEPLEPEKDESDDDDDDVIDNLASRVAAKLRGNQN